MKLLFVINVPEFFLSHRLPVALAAKEEGYEVHIATAPGKACKQIEGLGFTHHEIPLSRSGVKLLEEVYSFWKLWRLMKRINPDLVHLVTIKPVLYGSLVARLTGVPAVVVAISGLGSMFVPKLGIVTWAQRSIELLYKAALQHPNLKAIFQNPSDRTHLIELGVIRYEQAILIRGSGVDMSDHLFAQEPRGVPVVTFASRLLKEKGVIEFVESAHILRDRGIASSFWIVGEPDPGNPSSVKDEEIETWKESGLINYFGYRSDIPKVFASSNLVVLPSYYGEGLPKVLIEAAASGRAVITTDQPGCRDAIEPEVTGLLVPVRDAKALADAIEKLIKNDDMRHSMAKAGRKLAECEFGIEKVIQAHLKIYRELIE